MRCMLDIWIFSLLLFSENIEVDQIFCGYFFFVVGLNTSVSVVNLDNGTNV